VIEVRSKPCPICGRPAETRWRPFCSGRCADVDLLRWLNESYRIPAAPAADEGEGADTPSADDDNS
jgi:hypothetical protein